MYTTLEEYDSDGDGVLSAQEIKAVRTLNLDENSGITSLESLYNFTSLSTLTLTNINLRNLSGIEAAVKLTAIKFNNCIIDDYSALGSLTNIIETCYLYDINDAELEKFCNGISNFDFTQLKYLAVAGNTYYRCSTDTRIEYRHATKYLTTVKPLDKLSNNTKKTIRYLSLEANEIENDVDESGKINKYALEYIKDYTNLYVLRAEYNRLTSLKGLENMKSLTYLFADKNNLGISEGEASDNINDSLVALIGCKNLVYLSLRYNDNLKYVDYLKEIKDSSNNYSIKYLYLNECNNMKEQSVATIKNLINSCPGRGYPTKYWLSLLDEDITILNLTNQTITKSQLELLGNYTKLNRLNLYNLQVVDNSGNTLSNSDFTTTLNNTLKKLTKMGALNLNYIEEVTNIDFVSSMPELFEIMLVGCTNLTDLSVLEIQTNAGKLNLKTIAINNPSINLTLIQNTLSNLGGNAYYCNGDGLFISNSTLYKQLGNCTNLKKICIGGTYLAWEGKADRCSIDLTSCKNITEMYISNATYCTWKLPNSVKNLRVAYDDAEFDCSNATSLEKVAFEDYGSDSMYLSIINSLGENSNSSLKSITWSNTGWAGPEGNLKYLEPLKNCSSLETVEFTGWFRGYGYTSLEGLEKLTQIKIFKAYGFSKLTSICDLSKMTNLEQLWIFNSALVSINQTANLDKLANLRYLYLYRNNITDISGLFNCTQVLYLDLETNCLYDTSTYTNSNGEQVNYRVLDKLSNLNSNGSLRYLYLRYNDDITDFSTVSSLTWTGKSGF